MQTQTFAFAPVDLLTSGLTLLECVPEGSDNWDTDESVMLSYDTVTKTFYPIAEKTLPLFTQEDREGAALAAKDLVQGVEAYQTLFHG